LKREAFLRELRLLARKQGIEMQIFTNKGKGSHCRVRFGSRETTIQSGELNTHKINRIKKQLGIL